MAFFLRRFSNEIGQLCGQRAAVYGSVPFALLEADGALRIDSYPMIPMVEALCCAAIIVEYCVMLRQSGPMETNKLMLEAIALRKAIVATYNRMVVTLAPHILYTRHGELYLDAVTIKRDGQPPREIKLGAFKVAGLTELALTNQTFEPARFFDPGDPKYAAATLFFVEKQSSAG